MLVLLGTEGWNETDSNPVLQNVMTRHSISGHMVTPLQCLVLAGLDETDSNQVLKDVGPQDSIAGRMVTRLQCWQPHVSLSLTLTTVRSTCQQLALFIVFIIGEHNPIVGVKKVHRY